ncbi:hypothetical protein AKJ40_01800 [candidate division MSBL1 archaeon SCGC-AAA259M10]|uniref:Potassium transporter TrkA n=1 Tax=candidate division MSBL1 archaeon SCGC-AAA259M10 TaxID=1698270 RepID=A0A133V131_9EURY|nr:hypothetical protein AKJ40_01800 [candidate division MSBL1 archaeon SCGC-AAA259M10]
MKIVIVGGGRTGRGLAERLIKLDHEVTIIEQEEETAQELASDLDALVMEGSGSSMDVLKDAEAKNADVLAAVTGSDEVNFMACKLAKKVGVDRVITRVNESEHAEIYEDVGADVTISPVGATIGLFERAVTGPGIYGMLSLGGSEADVIEVTVSEDSEAVGKSIDELDLPRLCTIAVVNRGGKLISPRGKTEFLEDDRVIIAGPPDDVITAGKLFHKKNKT